MKRLILYVQSQDRERVDRIEFDESDMLTSTQRKRSPLVAVGDVLHVVLEGGEDVSDLAREIRRPLIAATPDFRRGYQRRRAERAAATPDYQPKEI